MRSEFSRREFIAGLGVLAPPAAASQPLRFNHHPHPEVRA